MTKYQINNKPTQGNVVPFNSIQEGIIYDINLNKNIELTFYNAQIILNFNTQLVEDVFVKAWHAVINVYKNIFSLKVTKKNNEAGYLVQDYLVMPFFFHDISEKSIQERKYYLDNLIREDIDREFNLEKPPLMRVSLICIGKSSYKMLWTKHHLLMDGTGSFLFLKKIFDYYYYLLGGRQSAPDEIKNIMSLDSYEQNESQHGGAYWSKLLLDHNKASLIFYPENATSKLVRYEIVENNYIITNKALKKINQYVKKNKVTLSSLLQGALALTQSIYANSSDLLYGFVRRFPNRNVYGIGLYTNTIPVRHTINYNDSPRKYLKSIMDNNKEVRQYCKMSLRKIKKIANISAETPLFKMLFDYKPDSLDSQLNKIYPDMSFESEFHLKIPYPFVFEIVNKNTKLAITLSYDKLQFSRKYVDKIFLTYSRILEELTNENNHRLSDIKSLSKQEYKKIIVDWNQINHCVEKQKPLHKYIEQYAISRGGKPAIIHNETFISYGELNSLANQFARYLQSQGVNEETRVALFFTPSYYQYISLLAVLKCGATIVPIDMKYPGARIKIMLLRSSAKYIVTSSRDTRYFQPVEENHNNVSLIKIDTEENIWKKNDDNNLECVVSMASAAYIIFTSGSTGIPKGVIVEHRQWVAMLNSTIDRLKVTSHEKILQLNSFGFDVFQSEWGMALLSGASLCIFNHTQYSSKVIVNKLREYSASLIICSSSILSGLPHTSLPNLKTIAIGGEPCDKETLNHWSENSTLYHVYGVTEAAICSTIARFYPHQERLLIGKPLNDVKIYILSSRMEPCPINVVGEIYIGGKGVARGYLDRKETNRKFITIKIGEKMERVYKTGDLAKWHISGEIEFIRRIDDQIKIRGNRIELSEIEKALVSIQGILRTCITLVGHKNRKDLIAYISVDNADLTVDGIKKILSQVLPSYMIPNHIVIIDEFPVTAHGKIDKELINCKAKEYVNNLSLYNEVPIDACNKDIVVHIKREVECLLNIKNAPTDRNLFDIGLDSISLSSLQLLIEKSLRVDLNIIDLLTHSTIESLAMYILSKRDNHENQ